MREYEKCPRQKAVGTAACQQSKAAALRRPFLYFLSKVNELFTPGGFPFWHDVVS